MKYKKCGYCKHADFSKIYRCEIWCDEYNQYFNPDNKPTWCDRFIKKEF